MSLARSLAPITGALALAGCVFGFRGEVEFADEASLNGLDNVQLELPPTDLVVTGEATRNYIDWQGTWLTVGGSSADALAGAKAAALVWETWTRVGRLSADIPLVIQDLTALDHLDVQTASFVPLEVIGAGSVYISGVDAFISVTLAGGDVQIVGGNEAVHVNTSRGDVDLTTSGAVEVVSGLGSVTARVDLAQDIDIETAGPVRVEIADASNIDIDIDLAGQIVVDLDTAAHVGRGSYQRQIGSGGHELRIRSSGGGVELAMLEP